jgi:hypothetical protein
MVATLKKRAKEDADRYAELERQKTDLELTVQVSAS